MGVVNTPRRQKCSRCGNKLEKRRFRYIVGISTCLKCQKYIANELNKKNIKKHVYTYPKVISKSKFHYPKLSLIN